MTTRQPRPETLKAIANYAFRAGAEDLTPATQERLAELVRGAVQPMSYVQPNSVYPYLKGMTELVHWANARGYRLNLSTLLSEDLVGAFLAHQTKGVPNFSAHLWRLAKEQGTLSEEALSRTGISRATYQSPYSVDEVAALVEFANSLSNKNRRETLLVLIALGAGCGISRQRLRGVAEKDVHPHGVDTFVAAKKCAKVLPEFVELLAEVCNARSSGPLLRQTGKNITAQATSWTRRRNGVPVLSSDRLRATYIVALMNDGASLRDVMAWTGLSGCEALEPYLRFVNTNEYDCSLQRGRP